MFYRFAIVAMLLLSLAAYAADTRQVQADFERCKQVAARVERSIRRYEDELAALERTLSSAASGQKETFAQELQALGNRSEYFRNRYERSNGQVDKIRDDLKNVSGPTCPSCLESSVNLYCRSSELLQTEIDEYLGKTSDLRARLGVTTDASEGNEKMKYSTKRAQADSLFRALSGTNNPCTDKAGVTLLTQARVNLAKTDSLYTAKELEKAEKALGIARSLLDKSLQHCGTIR